MTVNRRPPTATPATCTTESSGCDARPVSGYGPGAGLMATPDRTATVIGSSARRLAKTRRPAHRAGRAGVESLAHGRVLDAPARREGKHRASNASGEREQSGRAGTWARQSENDGNRTTRHFGAGRLHLRRRLDQPDIMRADSRRAAHRATTTARCLPSEEKTSWPKDIGRVRRCQRDAGSDPSSSRVISIIVSRNPARANMLRAAEFCTAVERRTWGAPRALKADSVASSSIVPTPWRRTD